MRGGVPGPDSSLGPLTTKSMITRCLHFSVSIGACTRGLAKTHPIPYGARGREQAAGCVDKYRCK
jgi:hypothetical protein